MPEEVKIAIKSEYDANGANRAKQDLRQLSQDIPASLNKAEKALAGVSRATADISPQADRAAAALSKIKAPDAPVQASASWKSLLTNISRGADSGTLSLSGLSGAALRFTSLSAGFAGVSVAMQGVNKALMQVGEQFQILNGLAADSSGVLSNILSAASDSVGTTLSNVAKNNLDQDSWQAEAAKVQYAAALHSAADKYNEDLLKVMADPHLSGLESDVERYYARARNDFPDEAQGFFSFFRNLQKSLADESDKAAADLDSSDTALATAKQRENIAKQQAQVEVETAKAAALEAEANNRRASINAALRATNAEINGFKEHYGRMRVAAQKDLQHVQFPDLRTHGRALTGNLRSLEQGYANAAKRLERSAARGDEKGVQNALDTMAKRAAQIEQITGNTGKVLDMYNRAKDQAAIIQATSQKDGLTADQLRENQIRQSLGRKPRYTPKQPQPKTEERAQYSSLQPASNAAAKAAQNAQKISQDLQALTSSLSALADATSSSNSSLASAIKSCQDAIKKINSTISTIRTKL